MGISFFWSKAFLMDRKMLWLLFVVNLLGTVYGYMWYDNQLIYTYNNYIIQPSFNEFEELIIELSSKSYL